MAREGAGPSGFDAYRGYSERRALAGSTPAARMAGSQLAPVATTTSAAATAA